MNPAIPLSLVYESQWFDKTRYEEAERLYYEKLYEEFGKIKMLKVTEVTTNQATGNNSTAVSKDDKRSKKEKKVKKDKKEKEVKKEQKLANGNGAVECKQTCADNPAGGFNNKLKAKCNGVQSQNLKGYSASAIKGREQLSESGFGHNDNRVADSFPDCKNTTKSFLGTYLVEEACSDLWNTDEGRIFEKASSNSPMKQSLASEVAKARQHIKQSLECVEGIAAMAGSNTELINRINSLEKENASLHSVVADLKNLVISLDGRVKSLEGGKPSTAPASTPAPKKEEDEDDGVDLFASDSEEESEEAAKVREARLAAYAEKKSKKPTLIAKSNIILSVSPWDDETDMKKMEECVRTIQMDGLIWGASKLVPLAYGIHKLHISCVVEDDKVSVDLLQEKIQDFEDFVQSVDIAAFNKV